MLFVVASSCALIAAAGAAPLTYIVNSPADVIDFNPGNGVCETVAGNGVCTLRAAILEANAHAGADTIILQADVTYLLSRVGDDNTALNGDLDVLDSVTIIGAGPTTIIDGNGGVLGDRVFQFDKCIGGGYMSDCTTGDVVATLSGVTIQHGYSAFAGGGILNHATLTLQNCVVTANTVNGFNDWGGGILSDASLTIIGSVVSNNISGGHNAYGGGIYSQGPLTIESSTISSNTTSGSPGAGGGLSILGGAKSLIRNSTISANGATTGGGIYTTINLLSVVNTTISGNASTEGGGGVYSKYGPVGFYNVTIVKNTANSDEIKPGGTGAGIFNEAGAILYLANSIVADNAVLIPTDMKPIRDPDQCSGAITSLGNNLLSDIDSDHCTVGGAYNVATVLLGSLQNNGGPTKTHALLPGSTAAIDGGNMAGCVDGDGAPIATDQRGEHRPYGAYCDVGAFEASDAIFFNRFEIGV